MKRIVAAIVTVAGWTAAEPLQLHPENPHYFLFRGKPTVLVTSGEHYGAVINREFDYRVYLAELRRRNLNHTRVWAGAYREVPGNFSITNNTLAPAADKFVAPWPAIEGGRFDLARWNPEYFTRLHAFMREADRNGIVVEMNLFCPFYEDSMWKVSPLHTNVPRTEALTLKHPELVKVQEAMVRKIVTKLNAFDNLYYEIANEPYFGGVTVEWQEHIAKVVAATEASLPKRHLISQNIANGSKKIEKPLELVSIFNFHYSRPPDSVAMNYALNRVIGNNETGFDGSADATYRIQGWDFLMAGGALYNNLDYSFAAGNEAGDFAYPPSTPGGGSATLRRQLGLLRRFFDEMPFVRMAPCNEVIKRAVASSRALCEPGRLYAVHIHHGRPVKDGKPKYQVDGSPQRTTLELELPAGSYDVRWFDTKTGSARNTRIAHAGGLATIASPEYSNDIALRVSRRGRDRQRAVRPAEARRPGLRAR
ncbi:MAG TPA: hypothetical protein VFL57_22030 [Bryobacteraceae bacterium]|nr:hypothetical protein [Bryobacteraceae bacterium]